MTIKLPMDLSNKVALVTGGGSGLGYAMAEALITCGAHVIIAGQTEAKLQKACEQLGEMTSYLVCNVCSTDSVDHLITSIKNKHGRLDILINNAGNHVKAPVEDMTLDAFNHVLQTHVSAAFYLSQQALPLLKMNPGSSIIFIASMVSYLGIPKVIGYSAAKSSVMGLVRGLASELSEQGIRVNGIAPGWISSPMSDKALNNDPERKAKIINRTPMGKLGEASDIGWASAYLASDMAKFVNGHVLVVDGGASIGF